MNAHCSRPIQDPCGCGRCAKARWPWPRRRVAYLRASHDRATTNTSGLTIPPLYHFHSSIRVDTHCQVAQFFSRTHERSRLRTQTWRSMTNASLTCLTLVHALRSCSRAAMLPLPIARSVLRASSPLPSSWAECRWRARRRRERSDLLCGRQRGGGTFLLSRRLGRLSLSRLTLTPFKRSPLEGRLDPAGPASS